MTRIIFIPGNGGCTTHDNWFPAVQSELQAKGLQVIAADFPDPELARKDKWLPFLRDELKAGEDSILVGHSSGAIAAMRFAEDHQIRGSVLVGAYYRDLDMETEKQSGYFDSPWQWDRIKKNQSWMILFASQDDPWIPIDEPRHIHKQLECEYHEYKDQGHFGGDYFKETFPELTTAILRQLEKEQK